MRRLLPELDDGNRSRPIYDGLVAGIDNGGKGRIFRQPGVQRLNGLYKVPWRGMPSRV